MIVRYRRIETLLEADIDDEVLLFDAVKGMYYATSAVGTFLWEALAQPRTEAELCALTLARYEVATERVTADIASFVARLLSEGLIKVDSRGAA
jgi:hypothetical protein